VREHAEDQHPDDDVPQLPAACSRTHGQAFDRQGRKLY
jgi:hypothetical protein